VGKECTGQVKSGWLREGETEGGRERKREGETEKERERKRERVMERQTDKDRRGRQKFRFPLVF
jgi:hypothetical protein